ncbi:hypothetical protein GCM10023324_64430 [Streptomyces youssoufiensis]
MPGGAPLTRAVREVTCRTSVEIGPGGRPSTAPAPRRGRLVGTDGRSERGGGGPASGGWRVLRRSPPVRQAPGGAPSRLGGSRGWCHRAGTRGEPVRRVTAAIHADHITFPAP